MVLANGYTEGFIPDLTGAQGLLDGRAPYTFDSQLHRANGLFRGAQAFFTDPAQHWGFLADNHVSWVVVGDPTVSRSVPATCGAPVRPAGHWQRCPGLERVAGDDTLTVFPRRRSGTPRVSAEVAVRA